MSETSNDNIIQKEDSKTPVVKFEESISSSNSSQNDNDNIYFSSNNLLLKNDFCSKTNPSRQSNNRLGLFDSEDLELTKKNLFNSTIKKLEDQKINEGLSTDRTSVIKVKNYNSPRKRYSVFKLIEKDKKYKKDLNSLFLEQKKQNEMANKKKERMDVYGNVINRRNRRKVRISFIDEINNVPLANVVDIESYKNYNYMVGIPKEEKVNKISANCLCCSIY